MAKKDPSLTLDYILKKQEAEKLSGLSSAVREQIGKIEPTEPAMPAENKIISELKKINTSLNVNLNKNIIKMTKAIENSTNTLAGFLKGSRKQIPPQTKNDLSQQDIEDKDYKSKELRLLEDIRDSLRIKEKKKEESSLAGWITALTIAIAAAIAALKTWAKLVKDFAKILMPGNLKERFTKAFTKWAKGLFEDVKLAGRQIKDFFKPVTNVFKSISESKWVKDLVKDFKLAKRQVSNFIGPFKGVFEYISKTFSNAFRVVKVLAKSTSFTSLFSGITNALGKLSKIGAVFLKSLRVFGRVFKPLGLIFAIWDTITGAIEGYAKEGIKGAAAGAIKGLIGDFFFGFFDLVKDGISLVLDAIGLDAVSKALDSFSFVDIFKKYVDMVFHPIDTVKDIIQKATKWLSSIEIPAISFSLFGKKFQAGPWKLGKSDDVTQTKEESPNQVVAPMIEVKPEQVVAPAPVAAEAIYNKSAENEEAAMYPFAAPATNIVNAPTTITRQTQNNLMKVSIRNQEPTIKDYFRSRFST